MSDRRVKCLLFALGVALHPSLAAAQASHVSLAFTEAGVTLEARNATLPEILNEWSRLGGARILNLEAIDSRPMTLSLNGVPEHQALDILLRDIGGYILSARADNVRTLSLFGALVVVPARTVRTSATPPGDALESVESQPVGTERLRPRVFQRFSEDSPTPESGGATEVASGPASAPSPASQGRAASVAPTETRPRTPAGGQSRAADATRPFGPVGAATPGVIVPVEQSPHPPETSLEGLRPVPPSTPQP